MQGLLLLYSTVLRSHVWKVILFDSQKRLIPLGSPSACVLAGGGACNGVDGPDGVGGQLALSVANLGALAAAQSQAQQLVAFGVPGGVQLVDGEPVRVSVGLGVGMGIGDYLPLVSAQSLLLGAPPTSAAEQHHESPPPPYSAAAAALEAYRCS